MSDTFFSSENLDLYLKELAKEYRKLNGKGMPAEIIMVGGASVLANYGFREMTTDIDAIILAASTMKDAINHVGDKYNLPNGWLNSDFVKTASYSPNLSRYSKYYKTFSNVLQIRTVSEEYLVAMKLMSGRAYKNDLSDIAQILLEHRKSGNPLTFDKIKVAIENLYGSINKISLCSLEYLHSALEADDLEELIENFKNSEIDAKEKLINFENDYHGVLNEGNLQEILNNLKEKDDVRHVEMFSRDAQKNFSEQAESAIIQQKLKNDDISH